MIYNLDELKDEFKDLYFDEDDLICHIDDKTFELDNLNDVLTLYRVVFLKSLLDLDTKNLGNHWTLNNDIFDENFLDYLKNQSSGKIIEGDPYIIKCEFRKESVNKELSLAQYLYNPNEDEIYINENENPISEIIILNYKKEENIIKENNIKNKKNKFK